MAKAKKTKKKTVVKKAAKKKVVKTKKQPARKKRVKVTVPALPWRKPQKGEVFLGMVEDFFGHLGVIALTLKKRLAVGETIHVHGHTTDFSQSIDSLQIGHQSVTEAGIGDGVGIKVGGKCRKGDYVFKRST